MKKKEIDNMTRIKGILAHIVEEMYVYGQFISQERANILIKEINKIKKEPPHS